MVDTVRFLLTWKCNLSCDYCCNEIPEVRKGISPMTMKEYQSFDFSKYKNICISGGEPFLNEGKLYYTISKIPDSANIYIYTNGILMTEKQLYTLKYLHSNLKGINIGLHEPQTFDKLITKWKHDELIRFHVEDIYKEKIRKRYPDVKFKFWHRNDCEMVNEDIFILEDKN
jgi:molybdenum cofactor biosynthesis enzyme MoaA